jgi:RimJ/RimL family protein N-acetyltransferase
MPSPIFNDDGYAIETKRLRLRWPRLADAPTIAALAGERAVAEMTASLPHPYPASEGERFVFGARKANALGEGLTLAIEARTERRVVIGVVSSRTAGAVGEAEIGLWLGLPFHGIGYGTETVQGLADVLFEEAGISALSAATRVINPAARRVLEKCGFRAEGSGLVLLPARGGVFPVDRYRLDVRTWASLKGWRAPLVLRGFDADVEADLRPGA